MRDSNDADETATRGSVTKVNRRKLLVNSAVVVGASTAGATLTGGVFGGDSKQEFDKVLKKAFEIEQAEGKEAMVTYLESKGYGVVNRELEVELSLGADRDGEHGDIPVSPDKVEDPREKGIKVTLTGAHDPYANEYHVSTRVELLFSSQPTRGYHCHEKSYGEAPIDLVSLGWNTQRTQYWELASTDRISDFAYVYSDYSQMPGGDEWSHDSVGFKYDDEDAFSDWADENGGNDNCPFAEEYYDLGRVGVKLKTAGSHSPEDREVYASYEHTWSKSTRSLGIGFGVGTTGPVVSASLTPESEVESTTTTTETDSDTILKISQNEMPTCC